MDNLTTLDLFSISQTTCAEPTAVANVCCTYSAPYFAYCEEGNHYAVSQGNCHHWDCPRCGIGRAKQEYWRIVQGALALGKQGFPLWWITITTRGAGLKVEEAEKKYLQWTNRLLSNLRAYSARHNRAWVYVQVTERQKRRHPHSHILTTFYPDDAVIGVRENWYTDRFGVRRREYEDSWRSDYLLSAVCGSGLGEQYDIKPVEEPIAVGRYIAKYMFKTSLLTIWPEHWRRVRYSHNFPRQEQPKTNAFPLIRAQDWYELATMAEVVTCADTDVYSKAKEVLDAYPVRVRVRKQAVAERSKDNRQVSIY